MRNKTVWTGCTGKACPILAESVSMDDLTPDSEMPDSATSDSAAAGTPATNAVGLGADERIRTVLPHDVGGQSGFGPVPAGEGKVFDEPWHSRSFGVTQVAHGLSGFNTDGFRHGLEREDAEVYATTPYWHRWILNAERMLVEGGVLAAGAVDAQIAGKELLGDAERTTDCLPHGQRGNIRSSQVSPRFVVGEPIRVKANYEPIGHTRLPDYVAGCVGTIESHNGVWVFPDTHAHGRGENPCWVYSVAFDSSVLWPADSTASLTGFGHSETSMSDKRGAANGGAGPTRLLGSHTVMVDVFEAYLEDVQ